MKKFLFNLFTVIVIFSASFSILKTIASGSATPLFWFGFVVPFVALLSMAACEDI